MLLLFTSNLPHNTTSFFTSIPDNFSQNLTSKACGKDVIDTKNKKSNKDKKKKMAEEVENERLYEKKIEKEYAKHERGA